MDLIPAGHCADSLASLQLLVRICSFIIDFIDFFKLSASETRWPVFADYENEEPLLRLEPGRGKKQCLETGGLGLFKDRAALTVLDYGLRFNALRRAIACEKPWPADSCHKRTASSWFSSTP